MSSFRHSSQFVDGYFYKNGRSEIGRYHFNTSELTTGVLYSLTTEACSDDSTWSKQGRRLRQPQKQLENL